MNHSPDALVKGCTLMLDTPVVIVAGRVYVPRPNETHAATVARISLELARPENGR